MIYKQVRTLFSICLWIYWGVCIIGFFLLVFVLYLITFPFDRFNQIPNKALQGLSWMMMKINPGWEFIIRGADPSKIENPTIVVANHQSFLDMPLIYLLPWSMKWVAKKSLFKIPILGWIIFMTGHIGIDRESRRSIKKLDTLVKPIQSGIPGMIFPEGTRTTDGEVKPFKNGAFMLARRYNFQVLPVVLEGGYEAMPAGSWKVNVKQKFTLSVLEPLSSEDYHSVESLKDDVYNLISRELRRIRSAG